MLNLILKTVFTVLQVILIVILGFYGRKQDTDGENIILGLMIYFILLTVVMWL